MKRISGTEGKGEQPDVTFALYFWPLTSWRLCTGRWWVCQFEGHAQWRAWATEPAQRKREEIERERWKVLSLYAVDTQLMLNYASCGPGLHEWCICTPCLTATVISKGPDYVSLVCKEAVEKQHSQECQNKQGYLFIYLSTFKNIKNI